jgi:hypothetical protein
MKTFVIEKGRGYPAFSFCVDDHSPKELVSAVARVVRALRLNEPTAFPAPSRTFFRLLATAGEDEVTRQLAEIPDDDVHTFLGKHDLVNCVGTTVFERLSDEMRKSYFPWNDVAVFPTGHEFRVRIRSLRRESINGQVLYYSPHKPTVRIGDMARIVAFTDHAIRRTCERIVPGWRTYFGQGDAYAFFSECVYFEPATLCPSTRYPQTGSFTFFATCATRYHHPGILNVNCEYAFRLLGYDVVFDAMQAGRECYYRRVRTCDYAFVPRVRHNAGARSH